MLHNTRPRERQRKRRMNDIIDFSFQWIWVQLDGSSSAIRNHSGLQAYTHTNIHTGPADFIVHLASKALPPFTLHGSGSLGESPWQPIHSDYVM
ncbi:Protein CHROMOSOME TRANSMISSION FIDELITY 7 [Dissostichus eleginoides]|uniref:Protein CHROMOSOME TRANSMISSION FIDELITY 7 n=1 Tax=Dissostichus eleginoides TaxID=100907 RepID=A0AAD9C630_DISEL|nr:Protein CHROMOSOME TRANSMISSION FIDELITY 7 [Dissostichus eleginoides]